MTVDRLPTINEHEATINEHVTIINEHMLFVGSGRDVPTMC